MLDLLLFLNEPLLQAHGRLEDCVRIQICNISPGEEKFSGRKRLINKPDSLVHAFH